MNMATVECRYQTLPAVWCWLAPVNQSQKQIMVSNPWCHLVSHFNHTLTLLHHLCAIKPIMGKHDVVHETGST